MKILTAPKRYGTTIYVTPQEAAEIIKSLSSQLASGNPNTGRIEWNTDGTKSGYFTIAIVKQEDAY